MAAGKDRQTQENNMENGSTPELTPEQKKMADLRAKHKARATEVVESCAFQDRQMSPQAVEACGTITMLFQEVAMELGYILPNGFRGGNCLESLETACMWAKKAIQEHDHLIQLQQKEQGNGKNSQPS